MSSSEKSYQRDWTIPIAACFISFVALSVSIWQGYETRRHHKLSLRPLLSPYVSLHPKAETVGFSVTNGGLGPAIIDRLEVMVDGQISKPNDEMCGLKNAKRMLSIDEVWVRIRCVERNEVVASGERMWVMFANTGDIPNPDRDYDRLRKAFRRLEVRIWYRTLYEEFFSASLKTGY